MHTFDVVSRFALLLTCSLALAFACSSEPVADGPGAGDVGAGDPAPADTSAPLADAADAASGGQGVDVPGDAPPADVPGDAPPLDVPGDAPPVDARDADAAPPLPDAEADGAHADLPEQLDAQPTAVAVSDLVAYENPANVLSFFVAWQTDLPVPTWLDVTCGDEPPFSLAGEAPQTEHEVFVMGVLAGATCELRPDAAPLEAVGEVSIAYEVPPLPDFLPELTLVTLDEAAIQPGWTLLNLANHFDGKPLIVIIVDPWGRYRWYYRHTSNNPATDNDVRTIPGGIAIGGAHGKIYPTLIDWEGSVVWEKPVSTHHDMRPYGDGHLLWLGSAYGCPEPLDPYSAGAIVEWDVAADVEVWSWHFCEHYTPPVLEADWSHLNTIAPFPDEPALLISSRNQNALFKVSRETGDILWKLGELGDFTFLADEDRFWQQHAPEIHADGHILLYDNGSQQQRPYSRALEIAYDVETMTAWSVWEFRHDPDIFAPIWGDADRLANGNTLITFGQRSTEDLTHLTEVTAEGDVVWELVEPVKWGTYRSERIAQPVRGVVHGG